MDILFKGLQFGTSEAVRVPLQHFEWRQLLGHLGDLEGTGLGLHLLNGGWVVGLVVELLHGFRFICCCCPFGSALWSVSWSRCLRGEREYLEVSCRCSCILFVIPCGVLLGLRLRFDAWLLCFTSSIRVINCDHLSSSFFLLSSSSVFSFFLVSSMFPSAELISSRVAFIGSTVSEMDLTSFFTLSSCSWRATIDGFWLMSEDPGAPSNVSSLRFSLIISASRLCRFSSLCSPPTWLGAERIHWLFLGGVVASRAPLLAASCIYIPFSIDVLIFSCLSLKTGHLLVPAM